MRRAGRLAVDALEQWPAGGADPGEPKPPSVIVRRARNRDTAAEDSPRPRIPEVAERTWSGVLGGLVQAVECQRACGIAAADACQPVVGHRPIHCEREAIDRASPAVGAGPAGRPALAAARV